MSTSRRKFLKTGMLAAAFAAVPLKIATGQSWKERDANPDEKQAPDTLSNYSKASFSAYLNSVFQIQTVGGIIEAILVEVRDLPSSRNGESFSLLFRGRGPLRQDTYRIVHPALGTFPLLLVPAAADDNGAQGYLATFNRLSFVEALQNPAPQRSVSADSAPAAAKPTSNSKPVSETSAPAAVEDEPKASPKKKRSWKEFDNDRFQILN